MRLRDYLSVPFRLHAETTELSQGQWVRRVAYPELAGCAAESAVLEEALQQLECKRIETIIRIVRQGGTPPVPRPPLPDCDPAWVASQVGVGTELVALIETSGSANEPCK